MGHYDSCQENPEETIKRLMRRIVELEKTITLERAASDEQERRLRFAQDETAKALARAEAAEKMVGALQNDIQELRENRIVLCEDPT